MNKRELAQLVGGGAVAGGGTHVVVVNAPAGNKDDGGLGDDGLGVSRDADGLHLELEPMVATHTPVDLDGPVQPDQRDVMMTLGGHIAVMQNYLLGLPFKLGPFGPKRLYV